MKAIEFIRNWEKLHDVSFTVELCSCGCESTKISFNGSIITVIDNWDVDNGNAKTLLYDLVYGVRETFTDTTDECTEELPF